MTKIVHKAALVTGSSSGVGAATACKLAALGYGVTINYANNREGAEASAAACQAEGAEALIVRADVADDDQCRALVAATIERFGRLDAVINNAGTTKFCEHRNLDGLTAEDFQRIYAVNTIGPFQVTRAAVPHLRKAGNAAVVNVASIAGITAIGSSIAYAASKAALINMTKSLARTLGPEIRVNAVCPGFIQGEWLATGMGTARYEAAKAFLEQVTPLRATSDASTVADSILYFLTCAPLVTGETLLLDGGHHLALAGS